jgi:hypothetical protein
MTCMTSAGISGLAAGPMDVTLPVNVTRNRTELSFWTKGHCERFEVAQDIGFD